MTVSRDAFALLLENERPFLRSVGRRWVKETHALEDLVQDAIVRAWIYRGRFEEGTSLRAWLTTILNRIFLTQYHKERRRRTATAGEDDLDVFPSRRSFARQPETVKEHLAAMSDGTLRALTDLSPKFRDALFLVEFEGASCDEATAALGVPIGTAMSRCHRARNALRARLAGTSG